MKAITKVFCLVLVLTLSLTLLAGCAADELTLLNAFSKQPEITSCESKTEVTLSLTSKGLKAENKESFDQVASMLNGMKFEINQKQKSNADKTVTQAQADFNINMGGISTASSVWVDWDLNGKDPRFKEILKVPSLLTMFMSSQNSGKEYMIMDMADLAPSQDSAGLSRSNRELLKYSTDLTPKFMNFLKEYAKGFKPGFSMVSNNGTKFIDNQVVSIYKLKLDDAAFKKLLSYTVRNLAQSESAMNFVKELSISFVGITDLSYREKLRAKTEIYDSFAKYKSGLPEFLKTWDNVMTSLKDVKMLGDKGIDIDFGINSEGYIISESGTMDFVIDPKAYKDAFETYNSLEDPDYIKEVNEDEGIYNFGVTFNTVITNINKDVVIDLPELTPENSFSFKDLLNFTTYSAGYQEYETVPAETDK